MGQCTVQETHRITQTKILLSECFIAEAEFASFLFECMDKHGTDLTLEEMLSMKDLAHKVSKLLSKIQVEQDTPPDKLPVYQGGYPPQLS
jgi:hypothetical protein